MDLYYSLFYHISYIFKFYVYDKSVYIHKYMYVSL